MDTPADVLVSAWVSGSCIIISQLLEKTSTDFKCMQKQISAMEDVGPIARELLGGVDYVAQKSL